MSKRAWYVIALLLLAGACLPVTGPEDVRYSPSASDLPDAKPEEERQPHRKFEP